MNKTITMAGAAFALALGACGSAAENSADLRSKADAAIEGRGIAEAVTSAVDTEAAKSIAHGAAKEALREALPTGEIAAAGAIIDEEALITGLDKAVDGEALRGAVRDAVEGAGERPVQPTSE